MDALASKETNSSRSPHAHAVTTEPDLGLVSRQVRGLPRVLYRNGGALFYQLMGLDAKGREVFFRKVMAAHSVSKREQSMLSADAREHYLMLHYAYSPARKNAIRRYFSNPKDRPSHKARKRPYASLDLAILAIHFGFPASVAALDRGVLANTLAGDVDAQKRLGELIEGTEEFFQRFWMVWRPVHELLQRWADLTDDLRERAILGLFVLMTISESLGPLRLAERFVPDLVDEFEDVKVLSGEDAWDASDESSYQDTDQSLVNDSVGQREPRTLQGKWMATLRTMSAHVNALEGSQGNDTALARLLEQYDELRAIGLQADRERRSSRGLSNSQFISRVRELIKRRGADWLTPSLPVAQEAWKIIPTEGTLLPEHIRQTALDWMTEQLERHAERAARCAQLEKRFAMAGIAHLGPTPTQERGELRHLFAKYAYFTEKRKTIERAVSQKLSWGRPIPPIPTSPTASAVLRPEQSDAPVRGHSAGESVLESLEKTAPFDIQSHLLLDGTQSPSPAVSGTTLSAAVAAFLQHEQTAAERSVREADLLWALINCGQLLSARCYAEALSSSGSNADLLPASLLKAAALAPFVHDDTSVASNAYHEALAELDIAGITQHFERKRSSGQYAVGIAASIQAALFFPAAGAPQLLRASNHRMSSDFARLLTELADLGEQGITVRLDDFRASPARTQDSEYRLERVQPIVQGIRTQLPLAVEFFKNAAVASRTLEDEAGSRAALVALEALNNLLSGAECKDWRDPDLTEWLKLPSRAVEGIDPVNPGTGIVAFAADGFRYEHLARRATDAGDLKLVRALLFELERTGMQPVTQQALQSFIGAGQQFVRDYDARVQTLHSRFQEALRLRTVTEDNFRTYSSWLEDLQRSAHSDYVDRQVLVAELDGVARVLEDTHQSRLSALEAATARARDALHSRTDTGDSSRHWIEDVERAIAGGDLSSAERYLDHLQEFLNQDPSQIGLHRHRVLETHRAERRPHLRSPMSVADERKIAALGAATSTSEINRRTFTLSLVFGSNAAGLPEVQHALESLNRIESGRSPQYRIRTLRAEQVVLLRDLRQSTRGVGTNAFEQHILHVDMPAMGDDPGLQEEIIERMYTLRPNSTKGAVRAVMTFGPKAAWEWFSANCAPLEAAVVTIPLLPWTRSALRVLLSDLQLPSGPNDVDLLERQTGGWYLWLRSLLRTAGKLGETYTLETLLERDRATFSALDPTAAHEALRNFGVCDVPHVSSIFADLIVNGIHSEFDIELLRLVVGENPAYEQVSVEVLLKWSERLGLIRRVRDTERFQLDPVVSALVERSARA